MKKKRNNQLRVHQLTSTTSNHLQALWSRSRQTCLHTDLLCHFSTKVFFLLDSSLIKLDLYASAACLNWPAWRRQQWLLLQLTPRIWTLSWQSQDPSYLPMRVSTGCSRRLCSWVFDSICLCGCVWASRCVSVYLRLRLCVSVAFTLRCHWVFWCSLRVWCWIGSSASIKWLYNASNVVGFFWNISSVPASVWNRLKLFIWIHVSLITTVTIVMRMSVARKTGCSSGFKIEIRTAQTALSGLGACCQLE